MNKALSLTITAVAALTVLVGGCGSDQADPAADRPANEQPDTSVTASADLSTTTGDTSQTDSPCLGPDQGDATTYVGLNENDARSMADSAGLELRVVGVDGDCFALTADLLDDRVNVDIVEGIVVTAARF